MAWWNKTSSAGPVERLRAAQGGGGAQTATLSGSTQQRSMTARRAGSVWNNLWNAFSGRTYKQTVEGMGGRTVENIFPGFGTAGSAAAGFGSQVASKLFYSPLKAFAGPRGLSSFAKAYGISAGLVGATGPIYRSGKTFVTGGSSEDILQAAIPTGKDVLHGALGGFLPGAFYAGATVAEITKAARGTANFSKEIFGKAKTGVSNIDFPNPSMPDINKYFDSVTNYAGGVFPESLPNLPVTVSVGGLGGGGGFGLEAMMLALGLGGGVLLGRKRRKKYKQKKRKKRHGRRK